MLNLIFTSILSLVYIIILNVYFNYNSNPFENFVICILTYLFIKEEMKNVN